MSYILDALRRAEADRDRQRRHVPGLHTQPPDDSEALLEAQPRRWLPWAGGGLLLLAGLGAGLWWAGGSPEPMPPAAQPLPAPAPAPVAVAAPIPPAEVVATPPAVVPATPASASPYLPPMPPPQAAPVAAPSPAAALPPPPPAPAPKPAAEAPIPRVAELPEALRRELPRLAISGSVYSEDPASRFVMINGEVQREGAQLGADLVLERIGARELVLRFKGQRFRQPV